MSATLLSPLAMAIAGLTLAETAPSPALGVSVDPAPRMDRNACCAAPPPPAPQPQPSPVTGSGAAALPGPTTPVSAPSSSAPAPTTPTGAPASAAPSAGPLTPRGVALGPDTTRWTYWWDLHRDFYLNVGHADPVFVPETGSDEFFLGGGRRSVDARHAPSPADVRDRVMPALRQVLAQCEDRQVLSAALIAFAKCAREVDSATVVPAITARLRHHDAGVRRNAVLALGITGKTAAVPTLLSLLDDAPAARRLLGRERVVDATRVRAAYALGLAGRRAGLATKRMVLPALSSVVADDAAHFDVRIAAIEAIRMLAPGASRANERSLRRQCVEDLWAVYNRRKAGATREVQSRIPPAIAQLLGRGGDTDGRYKRAFADVLRGSGQGHVARQRAAAIALGLLAQPRELEPRDKVYSERLRGYFAHGNDQHARYLSLMSLGRVGGEHNRGELLKLLASGSKATVKPWAALALGVLAFHAADGRDDVPVDTTIGGALHDELGNVAHAGTRAAIGLALGMCRYAEAADDLLEMLRDDGYHDELAGSLCMALALMSERDAAEDIHKVALASVRRPAVFDAAALALGRLGDPRAGAVFAKLLEPGGVKSRGQRAAVAKGLGLVRDRTVLPALLERATDRGEPDVSRAFAVFALGCLADADVLPWTVELRGMGTRPDVAGPIKVCGL